MMEFELNRMNFTEAGLNLHNKIMLGECPLKITRIVIGSGYLDEEDNPFGLAGVKEPVEAVVDIIDKQDIRAGAVCVTIRINAAAEDFYLREIAVMAEDPDDGEIMYHYCNYGDSADYIITYGGSVPITQEADLIIAISDTEKLVVDITDVSVVTPHDLRESEARLKTLIVNVGRVVIFDITIPHSGWKAQTDPAGYGYYVDVAAEDAKDEYSPHVTIHKTSLAVAAEADICPVAETFEGVVRLWAKNIPVSDMSATVALLKSGIDEEISGGGYDEYVLPVATADTLGGVMIGENISVTEDGTISTSKGLAPSDMATPEEVRALLDEVFNKE